jgi:hypothetical protein
MNKKVQEIVNKIKEDISKNCKFYVVTINDDISMTCLNRRLHLFLFNIRDFVINLNPDLKDKPEINTLEIEIDYVSQLCKYYSKEIESNLNNPEYLKDIIKVNYNPITEEYVAEKPVYYFPPLDNKILLMNEKSRIQYMQELEIFCDNEEEVLNILEEEGLNKNITRYYDKKHDFYLDEIDEFNNNDF